MMINFPTRMAVPDLSNRSYGGIGVEHAVIKKISDTEYTALIATLDGEPHAIGCYPTHTAALAAIVAGLDFVMTVRGKAPHGGGTGSIDLFWHAGSLFSMTTKEPLRISWADDKSPTTTIFDGDTDLVVRCADLVAFLAECPTGAQSLYSQMAEPYYMDHELARMGVNVSDEDRF